LIELYPNDNDVSYILASSYSMLTLYEKAFDQLTITLSLGNDPIMDEIYILHAHLCFKLHSHTKSLYPQAIADYDYLIQKYPEDMNYVLQRGTVYSCMHEFESAIEDFSFILYYQPSLPNVLCLR